MKRNQYLPGRMHRLSIFLLALLLTSCDFFNFTSEGLSKKIMIEDVIEVARQTIPASGGTVVVDDPLSPINGMSINVPNGSYASECEFIVSEAEIAKHKCGANFNPLTPLIQIDNGSGYSEKPVDITIPIDLPEGDFAMGFIYDETTGTLEGMPLLELSSNSITVQTRHFMSGSKLRQEWNMEKSAPVEQGTSMNLVIASVSESAMSNKKLIKSGFKIGEDDWEFPNKGSYLAPIGHCAGQSVTAMWYYYEQKLNSQPSLFNRYNLLNKKKEPEFMWMDNPLGYRFASVIQNHFDFDWALTEITLQGYIHPVVFKCFAAAIMVTGEPQLVLIRSSAGEGGHAMIVTDVDFDAGILYIADPNYPNNYYNKGVESVRKIELVDGRFKAYETGLTAGAESTTMDQIGYFGKTSFIDWSVIGKRYNEVLDQTIGTIAPYTYPGYTIKIKGKPGQEVYDGCSVDNDTLSCYVVCPNQQIKFNINNEEVIGLSIYDDKGKLISTYDHQQVRHAKLKPGNNMLGFYIYGWRAGVQYDNSTRYIDQFIDFKWMNINYSLIEIDPNPLLGSPEVEYTFTAKSNGALPKNFTLVWDFGDNTTQETLSNDSIITHTFQEEGNYQISVTAFDKGNNPICEATSTATIAGPLGDPEITYISPDSAIAEQLVTIHGNNFGNQQYEGKVHMIYNVETEVISWSNEEIVIKIPLQARDEMYISIERKTPADDYSVFSNHFEYNIYPDVLVTLKRVNGIAWIVAGTFINEYDDERDSQTNMGYINDDKQLTFNGLSLDYTDTDTLDATPGEEIFYTYDIHLSVSGDGQTLSGQIAYTGENRDVGPPTLYKKEEIIINNMKLNYFDHQRVQFLFTDEEGKSVISSFNEDGGHGWDHYVDFKEAHGYVTFFERTW